MSPRQAVLLTTGLLVVAMALVLSILVVAHQPAPGDDQAPIMTIKSCPSTCEMLV